MPIVVRGKVLIARGDRGEMVVMLDDNGPDEWTYRKSPKSVSLIGDPFDGEEFGQDEKCRITFEVDKP